MFDYMKMLSTVKFPTRKLAGTRSTNYYFLLIVQNVELTDS